MAKIFGKTPFRLEALDTDSTVSSSDLKHYLDSDGSSVTLLVRSADGPAGRGGFFFNLSRAGDNVCLFDFAGERVADFTFEEAAVFVNHASGREFSQEMLLRCQKEINFRFDPE